MIEKKLQSATTLYLSKDGLEFDTASLVWRLSRDVTLSLAWVESRLSEQLMAAYIQNLAYHAEEFSAHYVGNINSHFRNFILFLTRTKKQIKRVEVADLISYRSSLNSRNEWYLAGIVAFLKRWYDLGLEGVNEEVIKLLSSWRLKGNTKGEAILTFCPQQGALSDLELEALHQALIEAFEDDLINLENYALIMLSVVTGRRPAQIADLKLCDLTEVKASDGQGMFILRIPRRKQRGVAWRERFKDYALTLELGALLKTYLKQVEKKFFLITNQSISTELLPIFPSWQKIHDYQKQSDLELQEQLEGQGFHRPSGSIRATVKGVIGRLNVYSERTRKALEVSPVRLRRTLATRAAREGYGVLTIAELLDHSDTQSAAVYTENVPEHVDAINRAVAEQLAPIAQAFAGVLIDHEREAKRGNDLSSRVRSESSGDGVGSCGHYGFCNALAPIACYTCRNFQPWLDAPHEEVLEGLLARREGIIRKTNDLTMASVNDRVIFAVTEVIQLCKKRKQKQLEG